MDKRPSFNFSRDFIPLKNKLGHKPPVIVDNGSEVIRSLSKSSSFEDLNEEFEDIRRSGAEKTGFREEN